MGLFFFERRFLVFFESERVFLEIAMGTWNAFFILSPLSYSPTTERRAAERSFVEPRPTPPSKRCCHSTKKTGESEPRGDQFHRRRRRASACPRASTSRGRCLEREHRAGAAPMKEKRPLLRRGRRRIGGTAGADANNAKASRR